MTREDDLLSEFVVEANDNMADIENQLLSIEESGADVDVELINEVFRGIHSIKGAAGFLGLQRINDLAHSLENVLNKMRNLELAPNSAMIDIMLRAADKLQCMVNDAVSSNEEEVGDLVSELEGISEGSKSENDTQNADSSSQLAGESDSEDDNNRDGDDLDAEIARAFAERKLEEHSTEQVTAETKSAISQDNSAPRARVQAHKTGSSEKNSAPEASIRVSVSVLDKLMNLAGELVLSRNQLMQTVSKSEDSVLSGIASRLDHVTSEVQESIMQTRMQQIGTVFGKFPRIVRDLSSKLGKKCVLNIEGKEVEVDKTIVEAINDPLTHLIRNSIDHGIEDPAVRIKAGKPEEGSMHLRAVYHAGKVRIEIEDDGAGIDPNKLKEKAISKNILTKEQAAQMSDREAVRLIFHPGFSLAAKVTEVSGRGVGMDVVKTNIAKLGGIVDIESTVGQGTLIVITLPLTLAIIPSLIVQCGNDRFAIPQVNIAELVCVHPEELNSRIGRVQEAQVLHLRGSLLPLIRLSEVVQRDENTDINSKSGGDVAHTNAVNIIVVEAGEQSFGLIVDGLHDSEEIVVKPLGQQLQECTCLSGATILGDGHVALILDVGGIASSKSMHCVQGLDAESSAESQSIVDDTQSMLLFRNHEAEHFAISMDVIARIDHIPAEQIDSVGGHELLQLSQGTISLLRLENSISARAAERCDYLYVIVIETAGKEVGIVVPELEDIRNVTTEIDQVTFTEAGVLGSAVIDGKTVRLVDPFAITELAHPEWFEHRRQNSGQVTEPPLVLFAEDSKFFRTQVSNVLREQGYEVVECEDGLQAWNTLRSEEHQFDIVVTDIEMPNVNGFELAERIRQSKWSDLPVIALTSLSSKADIQRGVECGIDDYQVKMDRDNLLTAMQTLIGNTVDNSRELQPA